jgi:putative ABC transport system permease protein
MGTDFKADGRVLANQATYYSLQRRDADMVNLGMIKIQPGADIQRVKASLIASMPSDVFIFDRETLIRDEQDYYTKVKPIGLFFQVGVIVAFCAGAAILFQVLATDIANRFKEFATIKAMGFRDSFIYAVGFYQACLYGVLSYIPALLMATGIFYLVGLATRLPVSMTVSLAGLVLGLSLVMCSVSGLLALRKVKRADPADLF